MKIQLTEEQINMLIKNESDTLQKEFEANVKALEKKLQSDLSKLTEKYKFIEIPDTTPTKTRAKINKEELIEMVNNKTSLKELAEHFGTTEQSIRAKIWKLKKELSDSK